MPAVCLKQLPGQMLGGAEARAGERELAGAGLCRGDQVLHVVGREVGTRDDDQARGRDLRNWIERRERIVTRRLARRGGDDLAGSHDAERVAVLVGAGDGFIAQHAAGARPVLDHDRLTEPFLHRLRDDATHDVAAAAGSERERQRESCRCGHSCAVASMVPASKTVLEAASSPRRVNIRSLPRSTAANRACPAIAEAWPLFRFLIQAHPRSGYARHDRAGFNWRGRRWHRPRRGACARQARARRHCR